ncbi:oxidoreductase domain-containing protein [Pyricularia oryzae 70-15]|uniref:Oxidoreductase domain-containing protein n=3 Tax=Pyricularia oryzae TaxID=318829 RepID=G4MKI3_PYRO7|nr:oxidoreductase domain-containing protein [Pyricularia oryzae 70-15]EHA57572.1 oxidoreductase domain-containing protein [Pyricularia oryzae 70-15]ELQ37620.1 oxidoreductase domain protein [Pyricularia oryzae Y34]KAI7925438.1 oxidoreductase domain-containing protein [Pyricularia oryzae]KAI7925631.1 oxidoreductase domain-containing protein [Pyricularia oryzae]
MSDQKNFNVGVVGYGMSAKVFHIPFIKLTEGLTLHSIVQRSPKPNDSAPHDYPDIHHHTSVDTLVADPALDLVVISTTPDTHYAFVKQALEAGKHVLVEKPFVPTSAQAVELADLARTKGKLLCVYQNRRWDGDFVTLRRLLEVGELGRVWEFETHFDRHRAAHPTNWKASMTMSQGGGVVYDLGTHLVDQVYVLFGKPSTVSAKFVRQREGRLVSGVNGIEDEPDSVNAVLSYADSGLLVHVRIGVLSVEAEQPRFWVRGSEGTYRKTGLDTQEDQLKAGMTGTEKEFGRDEKPGRLAKLSAEGKAQEVAYPNIDPPATYLQLYRGLAAALRSGKEEDCPVPAAQAAEVLKIIEAMRESAKTGKDVVPA